MITDVSSEKRLPRTRVYIDGFNLYYAAFDRAKIPSHLKWLDLRQLCVNALPKNAVDLVRYCTAKVNATPTDPGQPARQEAYLQALRTIPELAIHYGEFVLNDKNLKLVNPQGSHKRARVWVAEEKGSDVNLASYLLFDAFRDSYDVAVVISNDSDLKEPVRLVRHELGKVVGVLHVDGDRRCVFAGKVDFIKPLRESHFRNSQFPDLVTDSEGKSIQRPPEWSPPQPTS